MGRRAVPFPFISIGGTGTASTDSVDALPTGGRVADPAGLLQGLQCLAQAFVLDRKRFAELAAGLHNARRQQPEHLLLQRASFLAVELRDNFQMGSLGTGRHQFQIDRWGGRRRAVFVGQQQPLPAVAEVEVGVTEGVDVAGA